MPVNENNKNEEMQSTSSDSTVKGARGTGDLITAIEGPSTSTARGDAALSSGSIQSKRFEDTKNNTENDTGSEDDIPDFDDDDDW